MELKETVLKKDDVTGELFGGGAVTRDGHHGNDAVQLGKEARVVDEVMPGGGQHNAGEWSIEAKFAVVLETASLNEEALAACCRNNTYIQCNV